MKETCNTDKMLLEWADCPQHDRPQIDLEICEKVRELVINGYTSKDTRAIIEQCSYESRCTDFAINALGMIHNIIRKKEMEEEEDV